MVITTPRKRVDHIARRARDPELYAQKAREATERWREKNPLYRREQYARFRFGSASEVLVAHTERMVLAQQGRCAICERPGDVIGLVKQSGSVRLCVDHDHDSGQLRGLLCDLCNTAIGKLRDDPAMLDKAAAYLRSWETQ